MEEKNDFMRKFLIVVFKREKPFFMTLLFTIIIVLIGSLYMNPVYESSSKVLLKQGRFSYKSTRISKEDIETEIAIIKSRPLVERVAKLLSLDKIEDDSIIQGIAAFIRGIFQDKENKDAEGIDEKFEKTINKLIEDIDITSIENSSFIKITYLSEYPEISKKVVNAFAGLAVDRHIEVYQQLEAYRFFQEEAKRARERIKELEDKLLLFKRDKSIVSVSEEKKNNLNLLAELEGIKNRTEIRLMELERGIEIINNQLSNQEDMISKRTDSIHNPMTDKLKEYLNKLSLEKERVRQKYGDTDPLFKDKQKEINIIAQNFKNEPKMIPGSETKEINEIKININRQVLNMRRELEEKKIRYKEVNAKIKDTVQRLDYLNAREIEIGSIKREIKINEEKYLLYEKKGEDARIAESLDREKILNISIVELAPTPMEPVRPRLLLNFIISIIVGMAGGIILIFTQEFFDHSFKTEEDIEDILELPVLSSISIMGKDKMEKLISL